MFDKEIELDEPNECIYCGKPAYEDKIYCSVKCYNSDLNE